MSRIFVLLAAIAVAVLIVAVALGLRAGGYNERYARLLAEERQVASQGYALSAEERTAAEQKLRDLNDALRVVHPLKSMHIQAGVLASLVVILVHSISVTYFIGTSRWCKEVIDAYSLDVQWAAESARLKRRSFPCAVTGMVLMVLVVALGAAADPATGAATTANWVLPHFTVALAAAALTLVLFAFQAALILQNTRVVERILESVRAIRLERGLDVDS